MQTSISIISITTSKGRYFFNPEEIVRLEASSNYTNIYFTNKTKMLTSKVLKEFAEMLEPFGFLRTHRTHLINRQQIRCIAPGGNIIMKDASVAEISRRMKSRVMRVLKNAA
jgi:two-component system LytT family response regulator